MSDDVHFKIGEFGGRVMALENRVDRHEVMMGERVRGVEVKLDGIDAKLDGITILISEQRGAASIRAWMLRFIVGISGALAALWIARGGFL